MLVLRGPLSEELDKLNNIWDIKNNWDEQWSKISVSVFRALDTNDMYELAMQYQSRLRKLSVRDKAVTTWPAFIAMKQEIKRFRLVTCDCAAEHSAFFRTIPLLRLFGDGM